MRIIVTCPSCGAEIELEDIAPGTVVECPACRSGFTAPAPPPARPVVRGAPCAPSAPTPARTTIQRTDKRWKILDLIGGLLICCGVVSCCAVPRSPAPFVCMVVGGVVWVIGRVGAWWTNG